MVYVVYHGTRAANVESIEREGLRPSRPYYYSEQITEPTVTTNRDLAGLYAVAWAENREDGVVLEYHIPDELVDEYLYPAESYSGRELLMIQGLRKPLPVRFLAKKYIVRSSPKVDYVEIRRRPEVRVRSHRRRA